MFIHKITIIHDTTMTDKPFFFIIKEHDEVMRMVESPNLQNIVQAYGHKIGSMIVRAYQNSNIPITENILAPYRDEMF